MISIKTLLLVAFRRWRNLNESNRAEKELKYHWPPADRTMSSIHLQSTIHGQLYVTRSHDSHSIRKRL